MRPQIDGRLLRQPLFGDWGDATNGLGFIGGPDGPLRVLFSDGGGWDHVSVSREDRCPTWEEMCFVKSVFFAPEEAVMQLHPPESDYRNCHPFCLHLWKPQGETIPLPPGIMVAPKLER